MFRQTTILTLTLIFLSSFILKTDNPKIQTDLKLTVTHKHNAKQNGDGTLLLTVTNKSLTDQYKIISPSDGSESAWREPYIYYTADLKSENGVWEKLEYNKPFRCGNYDNNWQEEIIVIKPKQTITISETIFVFNKFFKTNSTGKVRLVVHYDYAQGRHNRQKGEVLKSEVLDIPEFHLVSDTVEFNIVKSK